MIQAVIFDMNGVIIVDEKFHTQSWIEFCKKYNFSITDEELRNYFIGKRDKETLEYIFKKKLSDEESNKYSDQRDLMVRALVKNKLTLPQGLIELLNNIRNKNIPLAIATSSRRGYVDFIMETFNLRKYFPIIITAEDVSNGKPDPEIYLKTADKLKIIPQNCLVFEDSLSGIKSAKDAGMKVIAITTTYSSSELKDKADKVIENFNQVSETLINNL